MNDPYLDNQNCIDRLYQEYLTHKKLIVALDFDDTIFAFKNKNSTHTKVLDLIRRCNKLNFYVVIWTASDESRFNLIKDYCREENVKISGINENPIVLKYGNNRKIYYNICLCDRSGLSAAYEILSKVLDKIEETERDQFQYYIDKNE